MERKRIDEWHFWTLLAIGDRERNRDDIRSRMADLFRVSGAAKRVPDTIARILKELTGADLIERLDGSGLFGRESYRLTTAGRRACRDEIDLRHRELKAIDKDVKPWLEDNGRR